MKLTIRNLRRQGYKVRVLHFRNFILNSINSNLKITSSKGIIASYDKPLPKGGSTIIELTTPDKLQTVRGSAVCSVKENYNKKLGNSIALGRAYKKLQQT